MIGTILGNRYEILEIVGSGGMAVVYKAKCRLLNRYVAIKMLRDELKSDEEFVSKFRVEAQSAASLNHHNIVSVYDVGRENGIDYFVMEYIDGITLKQLVSRGPVEWKTACKYATNICEAIEHAHKKNIVHRDIKPHNIMITNDGEIKVTDFGIARAVSASTIVRAGNVMGSVHYFSPEQACGGAVDFKSDIYSIGVVLYEMLTGRVPFDADTPVAIAKMHVDALLTPPKVYADDIPQQLSDIVVKSMAKQPAMRYASAAAFADDLKKVIYSPQSVNVRDDDATQFVPIVDDHVIPMGNGGGNYDTQQPHDSYRKEKKGGSSAGTWVISSIVIVVAVFLVVMALNPGMFRNNTTIEIPDLVGEDYNTVLTQYTDAGFKIIKDGEENSDKYDANIIISQSPGEGISTQKEVRVVISKGRGNIILSNYIDKDVEEAANDLRSKGLNVRIERDNHDEYPENTVFKMSPAQGSSVKTDDTITLYVSDGKKSVKIKVPNLVDSTEEQAIATLESVGLKVGTVKKVYSKKVKGVVIEQVIAAGTEVNDGTEISFSVSIGVSPAETENPSDSDNDDTNNSNARPSPSSSQLPITAAPVLE